MIGDLLVLMAVIKLGYVVAVLFVLAFNDMTHKLDDLLWPRRCMWCDAALAPKNERDFCDGMCQDQHVEGGQYVS